MNIEMKEVLRTKKGVLYANYEYRIYTIEPALEDGQTEIQGWIAFAQDAKNQRDKLYKRIVECGGAEEADMEIMEQFQTYMETALILTSNNMKIVKKHDVPFNALLEAVSHLVKS